MKRSISITSALLLQILLHHHSTFSAADPAVAAIIEEELQDLDDATNNHDEEDIVNLHLKENAEKRHQQHNVQQDKSLIGRYTHHRNNIAPLSKHLYRILVQSIQFPHFKFNRKRRKSLPEKDTREQRQQSKSFERRMNNNDLVQNVDFVKGIMSNSVTARWVRAWCPPSSSKTTSGSDDDKSIEVVGTDASCKSDRIASPNDVNEHKDEIGNDSISSIDEEDDIQPGMVLFVESSSDSISGSGGEHALSTVGGSACLTVLGQQYDRNKEIVQYTLIEQELHLGHIDVHKRDFAYHPVVARLENRLTTEDEKGVEAFGARYSQSRRVEEEEDDRQVSFRWWSWVAHLSQILHSGHIFHSGGGDDKKQDNYNKQHSSYQNSIYEEVGKSAFAGGSHGEVWRARRRCPVVDDENEEGNSTRSTSFSSSCDDGKDLIVKRLKIELGYSILEAGLREVYFGELLAREVESPTLFTTYVDHFFREGKRGQVELWIVFENAGPSLRSYMYEATVADGFVIFQHSAFWRRLRMGISRSRSHKTMNDNPQSRDGTDGNGGHLLKEVLKQIVSGHSSISCIALSTLSTLTFFSCTHSSSLSPFYTIEESRIGTLNRAIFFARQHHRRKTTTSSQT